MKKSVLLASAVLLFTGMSAAQASSVYIGIGNPAPAYIVAPPPAYVVEPAPAPYVYYGRPYYYERHHYYDWRYWHDHDRRDHDRR